MPSGTTSGRRCVQSGGFSQLSRRVVSLWAASAMLSADLDGTSGTTAPLAKRRVCWLAVSCGVRPAGKGKVSKQVVGV